MEVWTVRIPETRTAVAQSQRAEAEGWDGIAFTDSQNLIGDPYVAAAVAAQAVERLRFATGVTNAYTRHPAALATVAATVQEESGGRFVLGIGRGDTALFHLGLPPQKVDDFAARLRDLQSYLAGDTVGPSRLRWLERATQPKVPLDVAVSGPRMIALAAEVAERVTFALGADPDRLAWGVQVAREAAAAAGRDPGTIDFGAYLNVACHPDAEVGRRLIAGSVAAFAHFSSMPGSTGAGLAEEDKSVVAEVGRRYDSNLHLVNSADHTAPLDDRFVDRFAVVGPPGACAERILALRELGIDRVIVTGASFGADPDAARTAHRLTVEELLPALQA